MHYVLCMLMSLLKTLRLHYCAVFQKETRPHIQYCGFCTLLCCFSERDASTHPVLWVFYCIVLFYRKRHVHTSSTVGFVLYCAVFQKETRPHIQYCGFCTLLCCFSERDASTHPVLWVLYSIVLFFRKRRVHTSSTVGLYSIVLFFQKETRPHIQYCGFCTLLCCFSERDASTHPVLWVLYSIVLFFRKRRVHTSSSCGFCTLLCCFSERDASTHPVLWVLYSIVLFFRKRRVHTSSTVGFVLYCAVFQKETRPHIQYCGFCTLLCCFSERDASTHPVLWVLYSIVLFFRKRRVHTSSTVGFVLYCAVFQKETRPHIQYCGFCTLLCCFSERDASTHPVLWVLYSIVLFFRKRRVHTSSTVGFVLYCAVFRKRRVHTSSTVGFVLYCAVFQKETRPHIQYCGFCTLLCCFSERDASTHPVLWVLYCYCAVFQKETRPHIQYCGFCTLLCCFFRKRRVHTSSTVGFVLYCAVFQKETRPHIQYCGFCTLLCCFSERDASTHPVLWVLYSIVLFFRKRRVHTSSAVGFVLYCAVFQKETRPHIQCCGFCTLLCCFSERDASTHPVLWVLYSIVLFFRKRRVHTSSAVGFVLYCAVFRKRRVHTSSTVGFVLYCAVFQKETRPHIQYCGFCTVLCCFSERDASTHPVLWVLYSIVLFFRKRRVHTSSTVGFVLYCAVFQKETRPHIQYCGFCTLLCCFSERDASTHPVLWVLYSIVLFFRKRRVHTSSTVAFVLYCACYVLTDTDVMIFRWCRFENRWIVR